MTCRPMREEGQQVFYAINSFEFPCKTDQFWNNSIQLLHDFVSQTGPGNASALRSIVVDVLSLSYKCEYDYDWPPPPRVSRQRKPDVHLPCCALRVKLPMCERTSYKPEFPLLNLESVLQAEMDSLTTQTQQMEGQSVAEHQE
ncbi:hypothetical protein LTR15_011295 [Elasticomyces elasticus]|nr:hypothetical protein LTR15_011295 [Elasticomyces elasticus]